MRKARPQAVETSALKQRRNSINAAELLVTLDQGEAWTTSLLIAEKFGKRHDNVLQAIARLECSLGFRLLNFKESSYTNEQGKLHPMFRISRDGFALLAFGFTGRAAAQWKEKFIRAFNRIERELRRIAATSALPDWNEARQLGKTDRRELTDAVQALCERAHDRGDSTTPLAVWEISATRSVTSALFETNGERITAVRDRLTSRQLRRLGMAEQVYGDNILNCLATDLHHRAVNERARISLLAFAAATGGKEIPGVERRSLVCCSRLS